MTLPLLKLERAPVATPDRSVMLTAGSDRGAPSVAFDQLLGGALVSPNESMSAPSLSIANGPDIQVAEKDENILSHNPRSLVVSKGVDEEQVVMSEPIQAIDITGGNDKRVMADEALSLVEADGLLSEEEPIELNQKGKLSLASKNPSVSPVFFNQAQRPRLEGMGVAVEMNLYKESIGPLENCTPFASLTGVEGAFVQSSVANSAMDEASILNQLSIDSENKEGIESVILEDEIEEDFHEIDNLSAVTLKRADTTHTVDQSNALSAHMQSHNEPQVVDAKKALGLNTAESILGNQVLEEVGTVAAMSMSMNDALIQNKEQGDEAVSFSVDSADSAEATSVSTHAVLSSSAVSRESVGPFFEEPLPVFAPTANASVMPPVAMDNGMPPAAITQTGATPFHTSEALKELKPTVLQHLAYLEAHRPATVAIDIKLGNGASVELTLKLTQSGKLQVNFGSEASAYKAALQEGWRGLSTTIEERGWVLDGPHFEGMRASQAVASATGEQGTSLGGRKANQTQAFAYAVHTSPLERQPGAKPVARLKFSALSEALSGQFA